MNKSTWSSDVGKERRSHPPDESLEFSRARLYNNNLSNNTRPTIRTRLRLIPLSIVKAETGKKAHWQRIYSHGFIDSRASGTRKEARRSAVMNYRG